MSAGEHRVEALLQHGIDAPEPPDEAAEWLASRGPNMGMEPEQKECARTVALAKTVETAAANGLSAGGKARLREILNRHWNSFRRGLRGDPRTRIEPLAMTFKRKANMVKARGRVYSSTKTVWLARCIGTLNTLGLVFCNLQAVWRSVAMAAPKRGGFRLVSDYHEVSGVMPNQEAEMADLQGATCFGKLERLSVIP